MIRAQRLITFLSFFWILWCSSYSAKAQEASSNTFANLETQARKIPVENLYLHTDKEVYLTGEIIWFRIYYSVDGKLPDHLLSQLAYVELLDTAGKAVLQAKVSLKREEQAGSFFLPLAMSTGSYTLRAYTNWMRNGDEGYFFRKTLTVINPLKKASVNWDEDNATERIDFLPEGGNLVSGLPATIGFRVSDAFGKGEDAAGILLNQEGDTITMFHTARSGMGRFDYTPEPGQSYHAIIQISGKEPQLRPLPAPAEHGYVLHATSENDRFKILIYRNGGSSANTETVLMAVHNRQSLLKAETRTLKPQDSGAVYLDKALLGEGINHITLVDRRGRPLCERLVFKRPPVDAPAVRLTKGAGAYGEREKVSLGVDWTGPLTADSLHDMSMSVYLLDSLPGNEDPRSGYVDYYFSELPGRVESPGYYFLPGDENEWAADNLMLVYGWRKFKWIELDRDGQPILKYLPEYNGHLVLARVTSARTNEPAEQVTAMLSVSGHHPHFSLATSDAWGICRFEVKEYYGNEKVICQLRDGNDSLYHIEILSPFATSGDYVHQLPRVGLSESTRDELEQWAIGMQTQNIYRGDSLNLFNQPVLRDTFPFYGKPDMRYNLDEYKRFTSMEEVLREYVLEIAVGIRGKGLTYKMLNPEIRNYFEGKGLLLIDGVPISNPDRIFDYDPLKVKTLDIIPKLYVIGNSAFQGVSSYTTYEGSFDAFELDPRLVSIDYEGLQLQREFYSPDYGLPEDRQSRVPDFRHTLYWNPHVSTANGTAGREIQFYTSDRKGKYLVVVEGLDRQGLFFSVHDLFEVK